MIVTTEMTCEEKVALRGAAIAERRALSKKMETEQPGWDLDDDVLLNVVRNREDLLTADELRISSSYMAEVTMAIGEDDEHCYSTAVVEEAKRLFEERIALFDPSRRITQDEEIPGE